MYLTIYKQSTQRTTPTNYSQLMQTPIIENNSFYKTTIKITNPTPSEKLSPNTLTKIIETENAIYSAWELLEPFENNYAEQYYEFQIPKRSGGLRTINAPKTEFKTALTQVKDIFEQKIKCLAHNSAYAYTKHRSILDALKIHQANNSNWYLKIDLKDFFPNCTPDFIFQTLRQLFPFYYISPESQILLKKIIKVCCLNGGLPQGTPMSPLLTNLIMVPYDYEINNLLKRGLGEHFVYTRYADDILISSKNTFDWRHITELLAEKLQPFIIKNEKTRYGSKAGSNWNLGLMLNKDNNITLGANKKRQINAMLNNFIKDYKNNIKWSRDDTQQLQGHLSYLKQIEPTYYNYIIEKYQAKYNIYDYRTLIKNILN